MSRRGSRAAGTSPRALGTNPRAVQRDARRAQLFGWASRLAAGRDPSEMCAMLAGAADDPRVAQRGDPRRNWALNGN